MSEGIEMREVTADDLKRLLERAEDAEAKFLLVLWTNRRPGESFTDITEFEILAGEVDTIELEHYYSYPCENSTKWLIIPKSIPVVIRYWHKDDYEGSYKMWEEIYIFTKDGWKTIRVK